MGTPLLSAHQISKQWTAKPLFESLSLSVQFGERLGIVGPNGSGKSTLVKILSGQIEPDDGRLSMSRGLRLSYVGQRDLFDPKMSVHQALRATLETTTDFVDEELYKVDVALDSALLSDHSEVQIGSLSGGQRRRLAIVEALLTDPELVFFDEPTNHLDLNGLLWLEEILNTSNFAWVMVTHDRYVLESCAVRIIEVDGRYPNGLLSCDGNYSDFKAHRQAFEEDRRKKAQTVATKVRKEKEWLSRAPKARSTKSSARVDEANRLIGELDRLNEQGLQATANISFTGSERQSKKLIWCEKPLTLAYGEHVVAQDLDVTLSPHLRLGIVGPNGSGKSTIIKALLGQLSPISGHLKQLDGLQLVHFSQSREELNEDWTVRRALSDQGDTVIYNGKPIHTAGWARRFLFEPSQLNSKVADLSGGERARLLIARLMLTAADVLILDEPTNDLDIPTMEILEQSLLEFPGCIVLVSHDRYLLGQVCNQFLGLLGGGKVHTFGSYSQWLEAWNKGNHADSAASKSRSSSPASSNSVTEEGLNRLEDAGKDSVSRSPGTVKLSYKEQREFDGLEAAIASAEKRLEEAQKQMERPDFVSSADKLSKACLAAEASKAEVDRLYARWAELEDKQSGPA